MSGAAKQRVWHGNAKCLSGPQVNDQFVFGWRLNRQITRFLAFEDAIDIAGCAPVLIEDDEVIE